MKLGDKYYAIRFLNDARYRVTASRFSDSSAAAVDLFGIPLNSRMVVASFTKKWRNMTIAEKNEVEKQLRLPISKEERLVS